MKGVYLVHKRGLKHLPFRETWGVHVRNVLSFEDMHQRFCLSVLVVHCYRAYKYT